MRHALTRRALGGLAGRGRAVRERVVRAGGRALCSLGQNALVAEGGRRGHEKETRCLGPLAHKRFLSSSSPVTCGSRGAIAFQWMSLACDPAGVGSLSGSAGHSPIAGREAQVSYALEEWCDAGDQVEKQSIVPPKQIIK